MGSYESLRPIERRVLRLVGDGVDHIEIARRFRRRPEFVDRVIAYTRMPRTTIPPAQGTLRPVERRILKWRAAGTTHADIGRRFHRSAGHIQRVEQLAAHRLAR